MKTITLHFNEPIAEKLSAFLSTFSEKDLKIEKDSLFEQAKRELQKDYEYSQQEDAFFTLWNK